MKKIIQVSIAAALIAATGSAAAWWDGPGFGQNRGWRSTSDGDWSYGMSSGIHDPTLGMRSMHDSKDRYYGYGPYGPYDPYDPYNHYNRIDPYNHYNRIDPNNHYNRIDPNNPNGAPYEW